MRYDSINIIFYGKVEKAVDKISLVMAWHMDKEPETQVSPHLHNYYELVYYHTGSGETHIGEACYVFSPRTCVLICPGTVHDEYHRLPGEVYCIGFRAERLLSSLLLRDSDGLLLRLARDILAESTRQQQGYQDMIQARLLELTVQLVSESRSILEAASNRRSSRNRCGETPISCLNRCWK